MADAARRIGANGKRGKVEARAVVGSLSGRDEGSMHQDLTVVVLGI